MKFSSAGTWIRFIPLVAILWFGIAITAASREERNPVSDSGLQTGKVADDFKIKIGVEEVRLDAVVVDGRGRQITDLTADDFKIYQDRRIQEIIECRYISLDQPQPVNQVVPSLDFRVFPPIPAPLLKRNDVRRTIVFIVHDYSMSFEEVYRTRMSLRKYVEEQMQAGDLVSILKTSRGSATLQAFTSDKQELLARIDNIQWSVRWDRGIGIMEHSPQMMAVEYCIKSLQDMPGRKYIMLVTPAVVGSTNDVGESSRYSMLADAAMRSGVVIHTLDIAGLIYGLSADAATGGPDVTTWGQSYYMGGASSVSRELRIRQTNYELPLSRITGGLYLSGFNWFVDGLGPDMREQLKGYYLLSYIPPKNTFSKSGRSAYHYIEIQVKRRGATIHTRAGFYGDPAPFEVPAVPHPPLADVMFSPFQYNDLDVNLASGYVDNSAKGYLLPTWMHLDGRDLRIVDEEDGSHSFSFQAAASTTDIDGIINDYGNMQVGFRVNDENIRRLKENGINFTISIPVKKPGGYYVRVAIKDPSSEAKGSAYQFIEVPDLKKNRLALSSLYIIDREEDAAWIRSMATKESANPPDTSQPVVKRNPARKSFQPGDSFEYMTVIYNAKTKKETRPDLESQIVLYRDGAELFKSEAEAIDLSGVNDFKRIPVRRKLRIEDSMQPGDYVLQFLVMDKMAKEKQNLTAQTLSFKVTAP